MREMARLRRGSGEAGEADARCRWRRVGEVREGWVGMEGG